MAELSDFIKEWGLVILPLFIIQIGLLLFAVIDLAIKKKTKNLSPLLWVLVICGVNTIGPVLYLILGRSENGKNDDGEDDI